MLYKWMLNESHRYDFFTALKGTSHTCSLKSDVLVGNSSLHRNVQWKLEITIMKGCSIQLKIFLVRADQFETFRADYRINVYVSNYNFCSYKNRSLFDTKEKKSHAIDSLANVYTKFLNLEKIFRNPFNESIEIHFDVDIVGLDSVGNMCPVLQEIPDFEKLLDDPKYCDFIIICSEKEFHVHKSILAARSEVFSTMFEVDMKEKREGKTKIEDFSPDVVQELLRFMYCGKVKNLEKLSADLLKAADMYSVHGLHDICFESLCQSLTSRNAVEFLSMAIDYKGEAVKSKIINFIVFNLKSISHSDLKTLTDPSVLQDILTKTMRIWL